MKKSKQIIILKAKVIKLKEQLKAARLELADRDNGMLNISVLKEGTVINSKGEVVQPIESDYDFNKNRNVIGAPPKVEQRFQQQVNTPIESTKELFDGKGYVYKIDDKCQFYFRGIDSPSYWTALKEFAKPYKNLNEFFGEFGVANDSKNLFFLEPITDSVTTPLTPPTKENINYDMGG